MVAVGQSSAAVIARGIHSNVLHAWVEPQLGCAVYKGLLLARGSDFVFTRCAPIPSTRASAQRSLHRVATPSERAHQARAGARMRGGWRPSAPEIESQWIFDHSRTIDG